LAKVSGPLYGAVIGFCAVIIFFAATFTVFTVGPAIETRFFPVVGKLQIVSLMTNLDRNSILMAEFTKLRNCEYLGLAWYRGAQGGGFERVPVTLMRQEGDTSSPNRPVGTQRAGPWIIGMSAEDVRGNSFAQLQHRCHGLWVTTTEFWP
jgi:hypothetical protein